MIPKIKIKRFNPEILELKRINGYTCTIVVIGKKGSGKCMKRDTPVLMSDGSIKMVQDIIIGDKLMGDDSEPRNVLSTCTGYDEMYKIKQMKGEDYTTNGAHILSLKKEGQIIDISVNDYFKFKSLEELEQVEKEFNEAMGVDEEDGFTDSDSVDAGDFFQ